MGEQTVSNFSNTGVEGSKASLAYQEVSRYLAALDRDFKPVPVIGRS